MTDFKMPSLGADMDNGTLSAWRVKPGDKVKRGDIIGDVETAKGVIEMECFDDGMVDELLIQPGTEVPVGTVIARICTEAEMATPGVPKKIAVESKAAAAAPSAPAPAAPAPVAVAEAPAPVAPAPVAAPAAPATTERLKISPLAAKVALDLKVDLKNVVGTGPGGAIVRSDIERAAKQVGAVVAPAPAAAAVPAPKPAAPAAAAPPPAPSGEKKDFSTAMRQAIAAAMSKANREIPHYYLETVLDMKRPLEWLEEANAKRSMKERILPVILFLKATALALVDHPELNGFWIEDHLETSEAINIGFAIALRTGGLVTPAIHHVDLLSLDELRDAMGDLILRTRAGRLKSSEMTDSTITLTSLGDRGVAKVFGVIYPPQVALVGFGKTIDQPWVENGMIGIRPTVIATLAGDHRASDGHAGGLFLESLNQHLQEVEKL